MDLSPHKSHLFREFVHKKNCPSLISYGLILSKMRPNFFPIIASQNLRDEENQALAYHTRKGNEIMNFGKFDKKDMGRRTALFQDQKKKDMSKVKCFICHDFGQYAS